MTVKTTLPVFAFCILASGSTIKPVAAATANASISVSATVQASCLASVSPTAIGAPAAEADVASAVSVSCSNAVPYKITADAGMAQSTAMAFRPGSGSRFPLLSLAPRTFSGRAANPMIVVVTY